MTEIARKQAARKFTEYWTFQRGSEKGEDQQFWNSLLRDVLGIEDVERHIRYQVPVQLKDTTKFLDAWIPETRVLIEHKSRGVNLDAAQSGHGGLTPYEQAVEYDNARSFDEKARWIVTCNFDEFRIYDRAKPLAPPLKMGLGDLPKEAHRLAFLVNPKEKAIDRELEISVQAGRIVGEIYDALLEQYEGGRVSSRAAAGEDARPPDRLAALNRLCVRLVFCLYAEDADIFPKGCFKRYVEMQTAHTLRNALQRLFHTLDTPADKRDPYLEPELCAFPYTNGGLFRNAAVNDIPPLTEEIRQLLIGASQFDWRDITPTIFGALFESTLNPVTRRAGGMVYTSVENIHKVIDPLFLGDLTKRVDEVTKGTEGTKGTLSAKSRSSLLSLQSLLASLTFLDPACGSGNFLTETYLSLRRLENRIIAALQQGQGELYLEDAGGSPSSATANRVKVSLAQFFGLEVNDFAVAVAKTALWIAEAQMLQETAEILHREPDYLPLHDYANIVEGNALRMDWPCTNYIMGNPPFSGARWMGKSQKDDMLAVFGKDWKGIGDLDYMTAWYKKAVDCMAGRSAFVSTNSICQGGAVANLWKPLFAQGLEIDFAWRTFKWDSEATEKAHVHCVIVGFHVGGRPSPAAANVGGPTSVSAKAGTEPGPPKTIFDGDKAIPAAHINGYLMDAPDAWIESRTKPLCDVPEMGIGNKPIDGGNYLFTKEEKDGFLKQEPQAVQYFHPWYGAEEFINGKERFCLWLGDCTPEELFKLPECLKRVQAVRDYRLSSKSEGTRKIADKPTRFHVENIPHSNYLLIPQTSSENRRYIPIGFMPPESLCSNAVRIVPDATLYHFGVLVSIVHMAWMRVVTGRMKSDYQYAANIVYNNFPWPDLRDSATPREGISQTAKSILDARAKYSDATFAQMYGDKMYLFPELVAAHDANDRAVLAAYGLAADTPEPEIVAHLFKLYAQMAEERSGK